MNNKENFSLKQIELIFYLVNLSGKIKNLIGNILKLETLALTYTAMF